MACPWGPGGPGGPAGPGSPRSPFCPRDTLNGRSLSPLSVNVGAVTQSFFLRKSLLTEAGEAGGDGEGGGEGGGDGEAV